MNFSLPYGRRNSKKAAAFGPTADPLPTHLSQLRYTLQGIAAIQQVLKLL